MRIIADIMAMLTIVVMARIIITKEKFLLAKEEEIRSLRHANARLWDRLDEKSS